MNDIGVHVLGYELSHDTSHRHPGNRTRAATHDSPARVEPRMPFMRPPCTVTDLQGDGPMVFRKLLDVTTAFAFVRAAFTPSRALHGLRGCAYHDAQPNYAGGWVGGRETFSGDIQLRHKLDASLWAL